MLCYALLVSFIFPAFTQIYLLTINLLTNGRKSFSISKLDVPLGYHRRTKPLENHEKKVKFYFIKCIFKKGSSAVLSEHCPEVPSIPHFFLPIAREGLAEYLSNIPKSFGKVKQCLCVHNFRKRVQQTCPRRFLIRSLINIM